MGLVLVDACLVIYALEDRPLHGPRVQQAFEGQAELAVLRARFGL